MAAALGFGQNGGADDVGGHHVGRELDTRERQVDGPTDRGDQHGLAQSRHAFEQDVAAGHQRRQHAVDDVGLPHDHPPDLGADLDEGFLERGRALAGQFYVVSRNH